MLHCGWDRLGERLVVVVVVVCGGGSGSVNVNVVVMLHCGCDRSGEQLDISVKSKEVLFYPARKEVTVDGGMNSCAV